MIGTWNGIFIFAMMILVVVLAVVRLKQLEKSGYCRKPDEEDGEKKV